MTNDRNVTLYTCVTNNLSRRVWEHKEKIRKGTFTSKYDIDMLVYYEGYTDPENAIMREKQIKAGSRKKKLALIEKMNPKWNDLANDF